MAKLLNAVTLALLVVLSTPASAAIRTVTLAVSGMT